MYTSGQAPSLSSTCYPEEEKMAAWISLFTGSPRTRNGTSTLSPHHPTNEFWWDVSTTRSEGSSWRRTTFRGKLTTLLEFSSRTVILQTLRFCPTHTCRLCSDPEQPWWGAGGTDSRTTGSAMWLEWVRKSACMFAITLTSQYSQLSLGGLSAQCWPRSRIH